MDRIELGEKLTAWLDQKQIGHTYYNVERHGISLDAYIPDRPDHAVRVAFAEVPEGMPVPDLLTLHPGAFLFSEDMQKQQHILKADVPHWAKYVMFVDMR